MEERECYTLRQAAERIGVSEVTLRGRLKTRQAAGIGKKKANQWCFTESDIGKLLFSVKPAKTGRPWIMTHNERIYKITKFIFDFKCATWNLLRQYLIQILQEAHQNNKEEKRGKNAERTKLRGFLDTAVKGGYAAKWQHPDPTLRIGEYFLTPKALRFMKKEFPLGDKWWWITLHGDTNPYLKKGESLYDKYRFDTRRTGDFIFRHHCLKTKSFFLLKKHLEITDWADEWKLRIGRKGHLPKQHYPDAIVLLRNDMKLAVEVERSPRRESRWDFLQKKYRYDITVDKKIQGVLLIAETKTIYKYVKKHFIKLNPNFINKAFILADMEMLEKGICFYQQQEMQLREAARLMKEVGWQDDKEI